MSYGQVPGSSASPLAFDADGQPVVSWESGLARGTIATAPRLELRLTTAEGKVARASTPAAVRRVLVDDADRERVTMHWAPVTLGSLGGLRRKKIAGLHLFVEERSDGLVRVEWLLSNGQVDPAVHLSHLGAVRHSAIEFALLEQGWGVAGSLQVSTAGDWYLPTRAWTSGVFVLHRLSDPTGAGRANSLLARSALNLGPRSVVSADLFAYPRTSYGEQQPVPIIASGAPVPRQGALWYDRNDAPAGSLPKGAPDAPAGWRIEPARAWQANEPCAIAAMRDVPRLLAGSPLALFDLNTGEPVRPDQWPQRGEYHLTGQRLRFDPWVTPSQGTLVTEFGWATNASNREFNSGPCASKALAMNYTQPYDSAHLCRITEGLMSAWLLTRSWAAWLALRTIAADVSTSWTLYGKPWDQYWKAFSLQYALMNARQYPGHNGIGYLREQGHVETSIASWLVITPPGPERDRALGMRSALLELEALSNLPCAINHAGVKGHSYNDVPWLGYEMDPQYAAAAVFQIALEAQGKMKLLGAGPRLPWSSQIALHICRAASQLYDNQALPLQTGSPPYYIGTIKAGAAEDPIRYGVGRAHDSVIHGWDHLARCQALTGSPRWLEEIAPRLAWPPVGGLPGLRILWSSTMDCWRALAMAVSAP